MMRNFRVTYDGGYAETSGRSCKEIPMGKSFPWGKNIWYVPAVYTCGRGLVMDFCVEIQPERIRGFLEKWSAYLAQPHLVTREIREKMERENPMERNFRESIWVNGKRLPADRSFGVGWIPPELLPRGERISREAREVISWYDLNPRKGWMLRRTSFQWATVAKPRIRSIKLQLEQLSGGTDEPETFELL